jgi:hypothetical protein
VGYCLVLDRPRCGVVPRLVIVSVQAGQERSPRGRAYGITAVCVRKANPFTSERIQIRGLRNPIARDAEAIPLVLVRDDEQHVFASWSTSGNSTDTVRCNAGANEVASIHDKP